MPDRLEAMRPCPWRPLASSIDADGFIGDVILSSSPTFASCSRRCGSHPRMLVGEPERRSSKYAWSALGLGLWCPQCIGIAGDTLVLLPLLSACLWLLVVGPAEAAPGVGSRRGRMELAVDGLEEIVVALGPGVDAEVGRRRGVRLWFWRGSWLDGLALDAGGESGTEMPREGELACPTRPY